MRRAAPNTARTIEAGMLLIGLGAILLLVSLFLEWYQPGIEAWDVFEVWDLVLALLAVTAIVAVVSRLGFGPHRPAPWLVVPAVAALIVVLYAIVDPPPATAGLDGDPGTGLWLALAAAILMAAGALLSVARISIAISAAGPDEPATPGAAPATDVPPATVSPGRGRFAAGDRAQEPVAPGATVPPTQPTQPTRRV